eukprot:TRINITY_DN3623_c0_g1_i5.p1 TRINITY_DN3623_c0_g1~~TRINITY_DN3623_c0_g1_i5.p1  ORF type:complete len:107 (-),score=32.96 TRINITY_DN3623_c0_g1_i5:308-628(-)
MAKPPNTAVKASTKIPEKNKKTKGQEKGSKSLKSDPRPTSEPEPEEIVNEEASAHKEEESNQEIQTISSANLKELESEADEFVRILQDYNEKILDTNNHIRSIIEK